MSGDFALCLNKVNYVTSYTCLNLNSPLTAFGREFQIFKWTLLFKKGCSVTALDAYFLHVCCGHDSFLKCVRPGQALAIELVFFSYEFNFFWSLQLVEVVRLF